MTVVDRYPLLPVSYWILGLVTATSYVALKTVYRLYFHPLRHIPGPSLAAATYWYEMYYDIIRDGQYTSVIMRLHEKLGPVIRISPEEIHVSDPDFYGTVFAPSRKAGHSSKRHRWIRYVQIFGHPEMSTFGTTDHDIHKMRRGAMERFFSPAMVKKLAPTMLLEKLDLLCKRLEEEGNKGSVKIKLALTCFTTDVISDYALGRGYGYLNHPTFFPEWCAIFYAQTEAGWKYLKPWPILFKFMNSIPEWLARKIEPGLATVVATNRESRELISSLKEGQDHDYIKSRTHPSIFEELLNSDLPLMEKSVDRLQGDGQAIIGAGAETTATVLTTGLVYILSHPEVEEKLRAELRSVMPDPNTLASLLVLEKLPYLTAVMRESLRLGYGIYSRIQRIADGPLQCGKHIIPPGTPIGMSAALMHVDPNCFPDPMSFNPDRWMDAAEAAKMYKYLVPFAKGPRMCIGINLAFAELYMVLAVLFRRFDLKLDGVSENDLEVVADCFLPVFKKDQKDFRLFLSPVKD